MDRKKILVIDDDRTVLALMTSILTKNDYEVITASDGNEALAQVKNEKPGLMILDVLMPTVTGYDFMRKLQDETDEIRKIPIIVTSARESMKDFFEAWSYTSFLRKPFDPNTLLVQVKSALHERLDAAGVVAAASTAAGTSPAPAKETAPAAKPAPPQPAAAEPAPSAAASQPVPAPKPVAPASTGKKIALAGAEEFFVSKVAAALTSQGCQVTTAVGNDDTIQKITATKPQIVMVQFSENPDKLDGELIWSKMQQEPALQSVPFYVFCLHTHGSDALKFFKPSQLVTYAKLDEVLKKVKELVQ